MYPRPQTFSYSPAYDAVIHCPTAPSSPDNRCCSKNLVTPFRHLSVYRLASAVDPLLARCGDSKNLIVSPDMHLSNSLCGCEALLPGPMNADDMFQMHLTFIDCSYPAKYSEYR
ncbi:hypothetical protein J6590_009472 [Homalodisca vitripennis]|nr:hypothetical protein J6590_009472 [Homalodisca vitripennis]